MNLTSNKVEEVDHYERLAARSTPHEDTSRRGAISRWNSMSAREEEGQGPAKTRSCPRV